MQHYKRYQGAIPAVQGYTYTITLEREDANPTEPMRELHFYGAGFTIEREPQESLLTPIRPTRLTLYLKSEYNFQFEPIAKDKKEWNVRLSVNSNTLFFGCIETGLYEEDFAEPPYEVRLTATCGLQALYDQDLAIEDIPTTQKGITRLSDFINSILRSAYPNGYKRNSLIRQSVAKNDIYIDPFDFISDDNKPMSKGEALEQLLHDLCLCVYSVGSVFIVGDPIGTNADTPISLGSVSTPIYATPQLQSDRGIGQLMLNLPSQEVATIAPYFAPKDPIATTSLPDYLFGPKGKAYPPPIRQLAVTKSTTASIPSQDEKDNGIDLLLFRTGPDFSPEQQGILLGFSINELFFQKPIEVTIPIRFTLGEGKKIPSDGEVMALLDGYLCYIDPNTGACNVLYQSTIGDVYKQNNIDAPWARFIAETKEISLTQYTDSVAGRTPREKSTAGWTDCRLAHNVVVDDLRTSQYRSFAEELKANRNYSRVKAEDIFDQQGFATFSFTFLPPLTHLMAYHNSIRSSRGETPKPTPNYCLFRLPIVFYHYYHEIGKNQETSVRIYPDRISIGKISIKYKQEEDKRNPFTEWLTADRATPWLRNRNEKLSYSTKEPALNLKSNLRYRLLNAEGNLLPYLYKNGDKPVTLVEHFCERYMRVFARTYDTLSLTVKSIPNTFLIGRHAFRVKGRNNKTYYATGGAYTPSDGSTEELTLIEAPSANREETKTIK